MREGFQVYHYLTLFAAAAAREKELPFQPQQLE
jgi:hypothetical protein